MIVSILLWTLPVLLQHYHDLLMTMTGVLMWYYLGCAWHYVLYEVYKITQVVGDDTASSMGLLRQLRLWRSIMAVMRTSRSTC